LFRLSLYQSFSFCPRIIVVPLPYIRVVALLPEAGSDRCALLLHDSPLVGDCLGRSNIANELLDCESVQYVDDQRGVALLFAYESSWSLKHAIK